MPIKERESEEVGKAQVASRVFFLFQFSFIYFRTRSAKLFFKDTLVWMEKVWNSDSISQMHLKCVTL